MFASKYAPQHSSLEITLYKKLIIFSHKIIILLLIQHVAKTKSGALIYFLLFCQIARIPDLFSAGKPLSEKKKKKQKPISLPKFKIPAETEKYNNNIN